MSKQQISIVLDPELLQRIKKMAKAQDRSVSYVIGELLTAVILEEKWHPDSKTAIKAYSDALASLLS